jgi:hypothetical protein
LFEKTLTHLTTALPLAGRAVFLRTSFNQSLIESLNYLLDACKEVIPSDLLPKATQKLSSLNPELKLSGLLSLLHTDFFHAADQQDLQKIHCIVERLVSDQFQIQETKYVNISNLNDYYAPMVKRICGSETINKIHFLDLSSEEFERVKSSLQRGLKVYEESFPDFFEEFKSLVGEILVLKAEGIKGGSSFDFFGLIHICYLYKWEKITVVLHFLVHEQGHLYVHLLSKDDPLIHNPLEKYEAPLRVEERPLIGIYHATFVLARMQYVLSKALSYKVIPQSEWDYCEEMTDYFRKRCQVGLDIVRKHAQMTPLADGLITSASKLL